MSTPQPLDPVGSIKTKMGLLVGVSVLAAAGLVALSGVGAVPWWLAVPVAVLTALALTQLLAAGMTSPLREMTAAARRMAQGDYAVQVRSTSGDEVGQLASAFNQMAADLASVDAQRRDLVANVSHELRTPLAGLTAQLENMADGVVPADAEHLGAALARAERLRDLVSDLLDLSRVEAGVTPLQATRVPVAEVLERCLAELDTPRGVAVDTRVEPRGLTVVADRDRLVQVVGNLLENAVRHSPDDGRVRVAVRGLAAGWRLEVADQGPGVAPADRERVFERFGTADPAAGGTGLGLAIARWLVDLHGGRLDLVDPPDDLGGALLRADFPASPPTRGPVVVARPAVPPTTSSNGAEMTNSSSGPSRGNTVTAPGKAAPSWAASSWPSPASVGTDPVVGPPPPTPSLVPLWPDRVPPRPDLVVAAAVVGGLAGLVLPYRSGGLGTVAVLLASSAVVLWVLRDRLRGFPLACGVLGLGLVTVPAVRDAEWLSVLAVLAAAALMVAGTTAGRTVLDFCYAALCWPTAALRGLPWLGRSLGRTPGRSAGRSPGARDLGSGRVSLLRTVLVSVLLLLVFGLLLGTGDAVVGSWLDALVPDVTMDGLVFRSFVAAAFFGGVLTASYLALNPVPLPDLGPARPLRQRYEWLVPVLVVDGIFLVFLVAQAAVFFGGHDYVQRTTGLTYAEYVHQGFGQLTVATLLTLVVIRLAAPRSRRGDARDRLWLRLGVGLLCLLTLVVVASALYRMHLYQQAYGFTVLRVLVDVFEGWLGLLVLLVMVAGVRMDGRWLARAGLLTGAAAVLALAVVNPEGWIADHNLERLETTGKVDAAYLQGLSADAAPAIMDRADRPGCYLPPDPPGSADPYGWDDDWLEWNLGRAAARSALGSPDLLDQPAATDCAAVSGQPRAWSGG